MRQTMKKGWRILPLLLAVLLLTACGGGKKEVTVDVQKLADELNSQTVTGDSLTTTAANMLPTIYFIGEDVLANGAAYMSAGSTACEVAVIECKDAKQTADVEKLLKQRVQSQSDLYASYNAGEVTRLDSAIIKSAGKYVVLCVCDDKAKAEEILKSYGF